MPLTGPDFEADLEIEAFRTLTRGGAAVLHLGEALQLAILPLERLQRSRNAWSTAPTQRKSAERLSLPLHACREDYDVLQTAMAIPLRPEHLFAAASGITAIITTFFRTLNTQAHPTLQPEHHLILLDAHRHPRARQLDRVHVQARHVEPSPLYVQHAAAYSSVHTPGNGASPR